MRPSRALVALLLAGAPGAAALAGSNLHESNQMQRRQMLGDEQGLHSTEKKPPKKKAPQGVGCIMGRVKWVGQPPALEQLRVDRDTPVCELYKDDLALIVDDDGGVANTFVFVSEQTLVSEPDTQHGIIEQLNCSYRPHAQVISSGSMLILRNADPLPAFFKGTINESPVFNVDILPGTAPPLPTKLVPGGMITVRSPRNPWQTAIIFVATTGFSDMTDLDGKYVIKDVPAGKYKLAALHEPWGKAVSPRRIVKQVTVVKNQCANVDFELNGSD